MRQLVWLSLTLPVIAIPTLVAGLAAAPTAAPSANVRRTREMQIVVRRSSVIAAVVAMVDEVVKTTARLRLEPCSSAPMTSCDRMDLSGPPSLVRTANAGSALGFRQGWWVWIVLAACGVLLVGVYARLLRGAGWAAAIGIGLQVGGVLPNLFDRVAFGGASDVLYVGGPVTWNLADVALVSGTLLATWALARRVAAGRRT